MLSGKKPGCLIAAGLFCFGVLRSVKVCEDFDFDRLDHRWGRGYLTLDFTSGTWVLEGFFLGAAFCTWGFWLALGFRLPLGFGFIGLGVFGYW